MQDADFKTLLKNSQLITRLMLAGSWGDTGARYKVGVSTRGHEFICEFGFHEFSRRLLAELSSDDGQECNLELLHDHDWILDRIETGKQNSKPGIISWIQGPSGHRLLLDVNPELVFFKGHFPGNPILPGIVQLHWAVGISMRLLGLDQVSCEVNRLKFSNIVQPPTVLELQLEQRHKTGVQFRFTSFGCVHSMGSLEFRERPSC